MEENKYYTPEIEEFFVGFECELKNSSHDVNFEWEKFKITGVDDAEIGNGNLMDWSFYDSRNAISEKSIRVKFLDREDIESLGWEFKERCIWEIPFIYSFDEMGIGEVNNVKGAWRLIYTKDRFCAIIKDCYGDSDHFRGEVKNKSELRKLMKMLQITK